MKKLFLVITLFLSVNSYARKITGYSIVAVRACSQYLTATPIEHQNSAISNFMEKADEACLQDGYTEWRVLESTNKPGFCIEGQLRCFKPLITKYR
jgi:hypothetical protein